MMSKLPGCRVVVGSLLGFRQIRPHHMRSLHVLEYHQLSVGCCGWAQSVSISCALMRNFRSTEENWYVNQPVKYPQRYFKTSILTLDPSTSAS